MPPLSPPRVMAPLLVFVLGSAIGLASSSYVETRSYTAGNGAAETFDDRNPDTRRLSGGSYPLCSDGLYLVPAINDCFQYPAMLPHCDEVAPGEQCQADGECGTDNNLGNCWGWDVYRKAQCNEVTLFVRLIYEGIWPGLTGTTVVVSSLGRQYALSIYPGVVGGYVDFGSPPHGHEFINHALQQDGDSVYTPAIGVWHNVTFTLRVDGNHTLHVIDGQSTGPAAHKSFQFQFYDPDLYLGQPESIEVSLPDGTVIQPGLPYTYEGDGTHFVTMPKPPMCDPDATIVALGCLTEAECSSGSACVEIREDGIFTPLAPGNTCPGMFPCVCVPSEPTSDEAPECLAAASQLPQVCENDISNFVASRQCTAETECNQTLTAVKHYCSLPKMMSIPQVADALTACTMCSVTFRNLTETYGAQCTLPTGPDLSKVCKAPCENIYSDLAMYCSHDIPAYEDYSTFQALLAQIQPVLDQCFQPQCMYIPATQAIKVGAANCRLSS